MKKILVVTSMLSTFLFADFIGFGVGGGAFNHDMSGYAQYKGDKIDLDNDMNLKSETSSCFWGYVEHPIPLIPNIKAKYFKISESGTGTFSKDFAGNTYTGSIDSTISLDQIDVTAYYEILDNWISADIGINIKYVDFKMDLKNSSFDSDTSASLYIPQAYAAAKFSPPFFGDIEITGEMATFSYDGNKVTDLEIALNYDLMGQLGLDLGIQVGYKSQTIKIDDVSDVYADIEIDGMFSSIYFNF